MMPPVPALPEKRKPMWGWIGTCVMLAVAAVAYRLLVLGHWEQTSLMFVGLPLVLAIGFSFTPPARTITGGIMRGITFFLLGLGILLIEGFICILMAAPLFYAIGMIVGIFADRRKVRREMGKLRCTVLVVLGFMALEGVVPGLSFPRENTIVVERDIPGGMAEARECLAAGPELDMARLPAFLKLGFPRATAIEEAGGRWRIRFAGGEGRPGDLWVAVREEGPGRVRYVIEEDGSHIAHWLEWHDGLWELEETGAGTVRATLTVRYRRLLDPAWYFGPIERYGVGKAAEYFVDELFRDLGHGS
jgi:hypothetical protein